MSRLILGVDASSKAMAVTGSAPLPHYCFESNLKDANQRRLLMYREAKGIAAVLPRETVVVLEEPLSLRNPKTNVILGLVGGAVWAAFADKVDVVLVGVSAWKKATVGSGNASKEQVRAWCLEQKEFDRSSQYFDEHPDMYDAWAIYRYALDNVQPAVLS